MKNVTDSGQKVKGQKMSMVLERASWVLGIDVGKEELFCALLSKDETFRCPYFLFDEGEDLGADCFRGGWHDQLSSLTLYRDGCASVSRRWGGSGL